jgi:hypothetical protein
MLVAASQIYHGTIGHGFNHSSEGCKVPVRMDHGDAETTMEVVLVNLLKFFKDSWDGPVRKMVDRCEA